MPDSHSAIQQAEGYTDLEMYDEAWAVLDSLPAAEQAELKVKALRLRICLFSMDWSKREAFAEWQVKHKPGKGDNWYQLAQARAKNGKHDDAKAALAEAIRLKPELKEEAIKDPLLAAIW